MQKDFWRQRRFWFVLLRISACLVLDTTQAYAVPKPLPLIQIAVEVVEVDETKLQQLGVEWPGSLKIQENDTPAVLKIDSLTRDQLFATLHAMLQEGAADMLANPKLVTRDNTTAVFHAGGEIPYIVSSGIGSANVEFKPYGVNLQINPHQDEDGKIRMNLQAEVSGPDDQNSVTLSGNSVPGILSRQVSSQLNIAPGATLTLAGLIQNQKQTIRSGIPGLMHIPILGNLFSYKNQTIRKTSIVVFVTPTVLEDVVTSSMSANPKPIEAHEIKSSDFESSTNTWRQMPGLSPSEKPRLEARAEDSHLASPQEGRGISDVSIPLPSGEGFRGGSYGH